MPRSSRLFMSTACLATFACLLLFLPGSRGVRFSPLVKSFIDLLKDMKVQLHSIKRTSDIGLLDRTYGYVLGAMLQSTFLMNSLGNAIKTREVPHDDYMYLDNVATIFDDDFHPNYTVYSSDILAYPKAGELKQAMKDMEDAFKFNLLYMLRTFRRGDNGLMRFLDFWRSLRPDRNGLTQLLSLANETVTDDFVSIWKRNTTLCDPARMRPLFFEIQVNIFREFVSREIYQGMTRVDMRPPDYAARISSLNLRMMQVLNICWQQQVKQRAEQAYALYYQERFSGAKNLKSALPLVFLPILVCLLLAKPRFFL